MDIATQARAALAAALEVVLPGRVHPYRPDRLSATATPAVWVDRVDTAPTTLAAGPPATSVDCGVVVVVDGADRAAQAMRDNLHAAIHDAVAVVGFRWDGGVSSTFAVSDDVTLPSLDIDVSRVVYVPTFCPLDIPDAVPIPPTPLEV